MSTRSRTRQYGADEAAGLKERQRCASLHILVLWELTQLFELVARALQYSKLLVESAFPTFTLPECVLDLSQNSVLTYTRQTLFGVVQGIFHVGKRFVELRQDSWRNKTIRGCGLDVRQGEEQRTLLDVRGQVAKPVVTSELASGRRSWQ
jgi:hypothetical protein